MSGQPVFYMKPTRCKKDLSQYLYTTKRGPRPPTRRQAVDASPRRAYPLSTMHHPHACQHTHLPASMP